MNNFKSDGRIPKSEGGPNTEAGSAWAGSGVIGVRFLIFKEQNFLKRILF